MATKVVQHGRVRGYRPTRSQLEEMLDLAQRGIDGDSQANLTYSQGDLVIYPEDNLKRVTPDDLDEIIRQAGEPEELSNLSFAIAQESPVRALAIEIRSGDWTEYVIESEDQTWAYGRYHELTEKLLSDRSLYSKFRAASPEVLRQGADKWQPAAWEPVKDWRIFLTGSSVVIPWILLIGALLYALLVSGDASVKPGQPGQTIQTVPNYQQALAQVRWFDAHSTAIIGWTLIYSVALFAYMRWLRVFLQSKVILRPASLMSRFSFRAADSDPVALGSFYVVLATLIIGVITLLVH